MRQNSLAKNYLYNLIYQGLVIIIPIITAPYIARTLGKESLGVYSYTYSIAYYFVIFAQLGIATYGNRTIAACRDNKEKRNQVFSTVLFLQMTIGIFVFLIALLYNFFINKDYSNISFIQLLYIISGIIDINWFFFGIENFKLTVTRNTVVKVLTTVLIFIFIKTPYDTWKYTLILSSGMLISQLSVWLYLPKFVKIVKPNQDYLKRMLKPILILFIPTLAVSIYRTMDKVMIKSLSDVVQVGIYDSSEKFISMCLGVINALGTVLVPRISNLLANHEEKKVKKLLIDSMFLISIIASAFAFGLLSISNNLILVFYGVEFNDSIKVLSVLSISIIFIGWANVIRSQYIIPKKMDIFFSLSLCFGALTNVIANLILIPKYGATGAAYGTVIAEFSVACIQTTYLFKKIPVLKLLAKWGVPLVAGTIMHLVIRFGLGQLEDSLINLIIRIINGSTIYLLIILIYSSLTNNLFHEFISKKIEKIIFKNDILGGIK